MTIQYYFGLTSPYSFMGHERLYDIAAKHGADVALRPVRMGDVMAVSGGVPVKQRAAQRQAYRLVELARWRKHLGMEFHLEPAHFPAPDGDAALRVIAADALGLPAQKLALAYMRAVWVEQRNIGDAATVDAIVKEVGESEGFDAQAVIARAVGPETTGAYDRYTEEAISAQVFGAPTYLYQGEMFWGQDRLDFLEQALRG